MRLVALAPAKVNLCLFLGERRETDARHELVTLFESISLADRLELMAGERDEVICPDVESPNLADQALSALRTRGWSGPPVRIELTKRIPIAAGLGGGSSDAAAALRLAHAVSPLAPGVAEDVARELGADVPSQLEPGLWIATGAGEAIEPRESLASHAFVIVPQAVGLSTAEVYREADRLGLARGEVDLGERRSWVRAEVRGGGRLPNALVMNDLGPATLSLVPYVSRALEALRDAEAEQILVCGSGPTTAGIYWGEDARERAGRAARELAADFPGTAAATPVPASFGIPSPASGTISESR